jgi:hypothetical protein
VIRLIRRSEGRISTNLSMGISLDGSIEGRLDEKPDNSDPRLPLGRRSEPRREAGCFVEVISRVDESLRVEAILSFLISLKSIDYEGWGAAGAEIRTLYSAKIDN